MLPELAALTTWLSPSASCLALPALLWEALFCLRLSRGPVSAQATCLEKEKGSSTLASQPFLIWGLWRGLDLWVLIKFGRRKKKNLDVTYSNIFLPTSLFQLQMRLLEVPRLSNALFTVFLVIFHPISF